MEQVAEALAELDEASAARVIRWAADRYGIDQPSGKGQADSGVDRATSDTDLEFSDLADLFFQASPSTQQEKILVAGFWFQAVKGDDDLTARQINDELKHLGHQVTNITRSFDRLMNKKPALAMQVRKTGSAQQAHKIYRLTRAGLDRVEEMLVSAGQ